MAPSTPVRLGPYELSMQQLCVSAGLPIPVNHPFFTPHNDNMHLWPSTMEQPRIGSLVDGETVADWIARESSRRLSQSYASENIFLHAEDSPEWKAHLGAIERSARFPAQVRRKVSLAIFDTFRGLRCIYCWLPCPMCICERLMEGRLALRSKGVATSTIRATMLLHAEELLRSTNTGHLVAFLLDSEIRVVGVADDDAWLDDIARSNIALLHPSDSTDASDSVQVSDKMFSVLLYPETGASLVCDLGKTVIHTTSGSSASSSSSVPEADEDGEDGENRKRKSKRDVAEEPAAGTSCGHSHSVDVTARRLKGQAAAWSWAFPPDVQRNGIHFVLSDGTWGQAHRVNRHVPRAIPRVALVIDPSYESLFAPLRKQTRTTGVSTLEATVMAVSQLLRGNCAANNEEADVAADAVEATATDMMKRYVDMVSIHKRQGFVFRVGDEDGLQEAKQQRRQHHIELMDKERLAGRRVPTPERLGSE